MSTVLLVVLGLALSAAAFLVWRAMRILRSPPRVPVTGAPASAPADSAPRLEAAAPYRLIAARHGPMLVNPNDFYLGRAILEYGEYGELEGEFLQSLLPLRPGAVVEVGANIGSHTVPLAKALASQGRELIAFEPQPFVFQNLCANLALNGIANVRAWPYACAERSGVLYFSVPDYRANGNFGGVSMTGQAGGSSIAVPAVCLDQLLDGTVVSLMKIDVEGYELLALHGARAVLDRSRPVLYVENDRLEKSQALIEWLWERNYRLWWHIPPLFNPDNFSGKTENIYGRVASFNMLALPRELDVPVSGLQEIVSSTAHPLAGLAPAPAPG